MTCGCALFEEFDYQRQLMLEKRNKSLKGSILSALKTEYLVHIQYTFPLLFEPSVMFKTVHHGEKS